MLTGMFGTECLKTGLIAVVIAISLLTNVRGDVEIIDRRETGIGKKEKEGPTQQETLADFMAKKSLKAGCPPESESKERAHGEHGWSYSGTSGPEFWKDDYPKCGGKKQSPININTVRTYHAADLGPIEFSDDYSKIPTGSKWIMKNNGHSVTITPNSGKYTLKGSDLPGKFRLAQFHFHWGSHNEHGSEHTINGDRYALEAHFVHYNTKYESALDAMTKPDGLAVLALLYQISEENNEALSPIVRKMSLISTAGEETNIHAMKLTSILGQGNEVHRYYRYSGSLTTPGCFESVKWTIFSDIRNLSSDQLDIFRAMKTRRESDLVNNFRPIQLLHNRQIKRSFVENCHMAMNGEHNWDYSEENGPDSWHTVYPKCGGKRQSPINIVTDTALAMTMLTKFEFSDDYSHYPIGSWKVYVSGNLLTIEPSTGNLHLSGGDLPGHYKLAMITFHWGSNQEEGSEHTIDGQKWPMEMHLIHYNTRDKSLEDAMGRRDGLAILAFFLGLGRFDNNDLKPAIKQIPTLGNGTDEAAIPSINLMHLMGGKEVLRQYYRYDGSMTTPPCEESVIWTVFPRPLEISELQLKNIRSLSDGGKKIQQNVRPLQAANNRLVARTEIMQ